MNHYLPETAGLHVSQALWESTPEHAGYRGALAAFVAEICRKPKRMARSVEGDQVPLR